MSIGRFLRKTYEITGYADTENGCVYCLECAENNPKEPEQEELHPIFLGDEWDFPGPCCDNCHEPIEATLIKYDD